MLVELMRRGALAFLPAGLMLVVACGDETDQLPGPLVQIIDATPAECGAGGQTIVTGVDQNTNGQLEESEIAGRQPICAGDAGNLGENGIPGTDALISVSEEAPGDNCEAGGQRIQVGLDDDDDGTLGGGEVDQTSYVCSGPDGEPGLVTVVRTTTVTAAPCESSSGLLIEWGLDDDRDEELDDAEVDQEQIVCDGDDGRSSLIDIVDEPAGANCIVGGSRIDSGLDNDADGELDPEEVTDTEYLCNAVSTRVRISAELAGTSTACDFGGSRIETGPDTDADGLLSDDEVTETAFVCSGADGLQTLVVVNDELSGANCPNGGQRVETGVDADGDGELSVDEVALTSYVCSGTGGADGSGGNLVRVSSEPAGSNCASGGARIETGPDTNDNGILDDVEVTNVSYACEGDGSTTLVATSDEPAGSNCAGGGLRIDTGVDDDEDGTLAPGEIDTTQYVCDAANGTQAPFGIVTLSLPGGISTDDYDAEIEALGGTGGSYAWAVVAGALPPGLTLDPMGTPSTNLAGTLTQSGTFNFTVEVTDFFGQAAQQAYTVIITAPPCEAGVGGVVGENVTTFSSTVSISTTSYQIAGDSSPTGFVYILGTTSLVRFAKDGSRTNDVESLAGLSNDDLGYEIEIVGDDIYVVSDTTSSDTNRVQRISSDGGQTFVIQDMMDFTGLSPSDLRGLEVDGTTMYVVSHDDSDCVLYEADISGTLPASASVVVTLTGYEDCSGLAADDTYFYTTFGARPQDTEDGVVRIDRLSLGLSEIFADFNLLNLDDGGYNAVELQDTDADGDTDVMFVSADSGARRYFCEPAGSAPFFSRPYADSLDGDNGLDYEPTENVIWLYDEGGSPDDEVFRLN